MSRVLSQSLALGIAAYLFFLVASAPAAKLLPLVQPQLPEFAFSGVAGSIWSGKAASINTDTVQLNKVSWSFHPLMLLLGRVEYSLDSQIAGGFLEADAGTGVFSDPYLADVEGRIAANEALYWLDLDMLQAEGRLDFSFDRISWTDTAVPELEGKLTWGAARVTAPLQLELGTVELGMHTEDGVLRGQLHATGGALQGDGTASMEQNGAYSLDANLRLSGEVPAEVDKFLSTFAEYKDGVYRLEWQDTL